MPPNIADSVKLLTSQKLKGKQCGVDFELKVYVAENKDDKPQTGNWVRLPIRKLTCAPEDLAPQPKAMKMKDFFMSPGTIRLEASLDKEKYYHGETLAINVQIDNESTRVIKKIRLTVVQGSSLLLHDDTSTCVEVCETDYSEGFPIEPNQTGICKVYHISPSLDDCRQKSGVAVDGKLAFEDTNLASSTIMTRHSQKDKMGIIVSYHLRVRLILGFGARDVSLELPFTLTRPKPPTDCNQFHGGIVFEEFARRRRAGHEGDDAED